MTRKIQRPRPFLRMRAFSVAAMAMLSAVLFFFGCGGHKRQIKLPDSVIQNPKDNRSGRAPAKQPYVIKMSDGHRTWQIEIPAGDGSPSFQASIPVDLGEMATDAEGTPPTEADKEIIEAKKAAGEPVADGDGKTRSKSYLSTIARVRELYKRRQYELALVDLVALDRAYPEDERILEMKGTLYLKLNRREDARKAWEKVLAVNPNNRGVAAALERLLEEENR